MHVRVRTVCLVAVWWLGSTTVALAQVPGQAAADSVGRGLGSLRARLDSIEAGACPSGPAIVAPARSGEPRTDSLAATLEALSRRLETLRATRCAPGGRAARRHRRLPILLTISPRCGPPPPLPRRSAAPAAPPSPAPQAGDTAAPPPPNTEFVGRQRNASALNPEISATGDIRLVAREGRQRDNGVAREFEVALQSALDPYSNTKIFLTFEDEEVGVEEGYIYWTGLPGRLRVDVGKFRQQVGDLNRWHLHALPETEYPLVYQRFLGPEGLTGVGPLALHRAAGLARRRHPRGLGSRARPPRAIRSTPAATSPRCSSGCRTSGSSPARTYAQLGFTGTGGNNDDADLRSRLAGLDFRLTYRPPKAGTRREITLPGRRLSVPRHRARHHAPTATAPSWT